MVECIIAARWWLVRSGLLQSVIFFGKLIDLSVIAQLSTNCRATTAVGWWFVTSCVIILFDVILVFCYHFGQVSLLQTSGVILVLKGWIVGNTLDFTVYLWWRVRHVRIDSRLRTTIFLGCNFIWLQSCGQLLVHFCRSMARGTISDTRPYSHILCQTIIVSANILQRVYMW